MSELNITELTPAFGAEVIGFRPEMPLDAQTCRFLQDLFDRRGVLVFRELDIDHAYQLYLSRMLIRQDDAGDGTGGEAAALEDNFYISNKRPASAAPFGRLQFHSDTMWAPGPFEVLSLYGVDVEEPAIPTSFVSGVNAWATLPDHLRQRVQGLSALHTAGEVRRGDLTDVLVSTVENPPHTIAPIAYRHPRTGQTILYICEQMTKEIVGLDPGESERVARRALRTSLQSCEPLGSRMAPTRLGRVGQPGHATREAQRPHRWAGPHAPKGRQPYSPSEL